MLSQERLTTDSPCVRQLEALTAVSFVDDTPPAHYGNMGYTYVVTEPAVIETDDRSRAVLPGHPNQRFVMRENPDGSLLLQPAQVVTDAQHEFDSDPELRDLLARAAAAPTVRRARARRT
ncbi:hypothetical protein [Mycobacterium sp.]|uniref:hypothetical protein n=1 Tax=Mycobacterium sp. TaxID=1785 RepID=UPI003F9B2E9D